MDTQTIEKNKKIARQSLEAMTESNYHLLEKITNTKKFKMHFPGDKHPLNFEESVNMNKEYNSAFPDAKVSIEKQIAEGDYVATMVTFSGTNKGKFQDMTASGKKMKISAMILQRIEDDKIVEEWDEFDAVGMLQQIGAIPEMETKETRYEYTK